jgi:hypothetical protein
VPAPPEMAERYDFLAPRLRLFVSLDIQGSTSFKYASDNVETWLPIIHWFYIETQSTVERSWLKISERLRHDVPIAEPGPEPVFWKSAGDELLFVKEITHPLQCVGAVLAFKDVLVQQNDGIQRRSGGRLKLKATAWLGGFPNLNKEIPLVGSYGPETGAHADDAMLRIARLDQGTLPHQRDFVGPSIDLGFRLAELATPRRFVVSVELAYVLADMMVRNDLIDRVNLQVDEGQVLKGILNDKEYPVIWVDALAHRSPRTSLERLMSRTSCNAEALRDMCGHFISEAPILVMPYIFVGNRCVYGTVPPEHSEKLTTIRKRIGQELGKEEQFVQDQVVAEGSGSLDLELSKNLEEQAAKVRGGQVGDDKEA